GSSPKAPTGAIAMRPADTIQPAEFAKFKKGGEDEFVRCTAEIEPNPKGVFGFNLARELKVVPVRLVVTLKDPSKPVIVSRAEMDPILFSETGAVLPPVDPEVLRQKITSRKQDQYLKSVFEGRNLRSLDKSDEVSGYLFFQLPAGPLNKDDYFTHSEDGGIVYSGVLSRSMLQFTYEWERKTGQEVETGSNIINVGTY
ncbi:MAG: hypothetical protein AAGG01_04640, partial [Planctomycetota bacterium]